MMRSCHLFRYVLHMSRNRKIDVANFGAVSNGGHFGIQNGCHDHAFFFNEYNYCSYFKNNIKILSHNMSEHE